MATLRDTPTAAQFQTARNQLDRDTGDIIACLNKRKAELLKEINRVEREFADKQQQQKKEYHILKKMRSNAKELGAEKQRKMTDNLDLEIQRIRLDCKQELSNRISIKWEFNKTVLIQSINRSKLELVTEPLSADCSVLSDTTESSEDLNTEQVIPSGFNSDSEGDTPDRSVSPSPRERPFWEVPQFRPRYTNRRFRNNSDSFRGPYVTRGGDRKTRDAYTDESADSYDGGYRYPRRQRERGARRNFPRRRYERGRFRNNHRRSGNVSD